MRRMLAPASIFADVSYQETTKITGGSMVGMMKMASVFSKSARNQLNEPQVTTVSISGARMSRNSAAAMQIIDLDAGTITSVNKAKQEYTVTTFEELQQQMEKAASRSRQARAEEKNGTDPKANVKFQVHVKNTGATKDVSGQETKEAILSLTMESTDASSGQSGSMAVTSDMWLAPEQAIYGEAREFQVKMAEKMGPAMKSLSGSFAALQQQQPGSADAMKDFAAESSKMKGVPLLQITRMGMTANGTPLPAASEAPLPASSGSGDGQQAAAPSAGGMVASGLGSAIGGLGGFGGFGRKKKAQTEEPRQPEANNASTSSPGYTVLMETETRIDNLKASANPEDFQIPAGYKKVERPDR